MPLRTAVIGGAALLCGAAVGTVAAHMTAAAGHGDPRVGHVTTGLVALWVADKLDRIIADPDDPSKGAKQ